MLGGILFGYVMYDITHYYLHHGQPKVPTLKHLKVRKSISKISLSFFFAFKYAPSGGSNVFWYIRFTEVPPESSLQNPGQRIWNHFFSLGQSLWNTSRCKSRSEEELNRICVCHLQIVVEKLTDLCVYSDILYQVLHLLLTTCIHFYISSGA